jgi:hypothetical protein
MNQIEGTSRPGAAGHRFGPGLQCTECGVTWDEHQQTPRDCKGAAAKARGVEDPAKVERSAAPDSRAGSRDGALARPSRMSFPSG